MMRATLVMTRTMRGLRALGPVVVVVALAGLARGQDGLQPGATSASAWQQYDWLTPADEKAQVETYHAAISQDMGDPFTVLSAGSLWQEKYGAVDTRQLGDGLSVSCETSAVALDNYSDDLSRGQKVGLQFVPLPELTLRCDVHDAASDEPMFADSSMTSGADFSAESHLPLNAILTIGMQANTTTSDAPSGLDSRTNACDVQLKQPISSLPLTAILKGHYEGTSIGNAEPTSLPSLEQSLEWKPLTNTTIQAGLRQQQYQEYPGVDHQLNEALFADWSQNIVGDVSWHSYAEVLNSKGLLDQAPAAPIASGANGTPQATLPGSNASLTSSLPISVDDQTLTFSTGPSFKLQKDISASVEYSDRWDKNASSGGSGQEQRVSVSLKGTF
jgi:hypothetical protein